MVAVEMGVVRQCGVMAITTSLDIIRVFIRRTRKCPMYIVLIDSIDSWRCGELMEERRYTM